MVRPILEQVSSHFGSLPLAIGLFISVSALVALCVRHARHASKETPKRPIGSDFMPKSKHLVMSISNKVIPFINKKGASEAEERVEEEGGFGNDNGLWQKAILMGEKCQPPDFSGAIYYDSYGNQLEQPPLRSPRVSPLHNLSFPVSRDVQQKCDI